MLWLIIVRCLGYDTNLNRSTGQGGEYQNDNAGKNEFGVCFHGLSPVIFLNDQVFVRDYHCK
jgi:hypothetical protein